MAAQAIFPTGHIQCAGHFCIELQAERAYMIASLWGNKARTGRIRTGRASSRDPLSFPKGAIKTGGANRMAGKFVV
jgi:hypothetical protein